MPKNNQEDCYYWPLWFSLLLPNDEQKILSKILPKIQTAQLYLWRALNIYDDLIDGDCQAKQKLITANSYYRRFLNIHFSLGLKNEYYKLLNNLLTIWESANRKEIARRQKSWSDQNNDLKKSADSLTYLADKSLVLASGPLALLFYLNYNLRSPIVTASLNFWRSYLSAKQLSDDSRDWHEDLENNILTFANAPMAAQLGFKDIRLNSKSGHPEMDIIFIRRAAPLIINNLKVLGKQARAALKKINSAESPLILNKLIIPLEEAAGKSENFLKLSGLYLS